MTPLAETSADTGSNRTKVAKLKVLVVSAGKSDVNRIRKSLDDSGFVVALRQSTSQNSFVKSVGTESPDLIVADYRFPGFDSIEALRYLKTRGMKLPFIIVADSMSERVAARCVEAGASVCIPKSDISHLRESIDGLINRKDDSSIQGHRNGSEYYEILSEVENRTGTGFIVVDGRSKRPLHINSSFSAMTGYTAGEILNLASIESLLVPADLNTFEKSVKALSGKPNKAISFPASVTASDGRSVELEFTVAEFVDSGRDKIAMVVRTARTAKQGVTGKSPDGVSCELCEYGFGFRSMIEDVKDYGIFILDASGKITTWNTGVKRLVGYRESEIMGVELTSLLTEDAEGRARLASFLDGSTKAGRVELECWFVRKDGEKVWAGITLTRLLSSQGTLKGYSVVLRDLEPRRLAEDQLREREAQLHSLAAHLQTAREEERANIARLLHDEFGQMLTALRMDLSILGRMVSRTVSESLGRMSLLEKISSIAEVLERTIRSTRKIITDLRPAVLDELGLLTAIQWQVLEFENRTGIHCVIKRLQHDITLDANASTATFRILQEALNNVMRHSAATKVSISMQVVEPNIVLEISDNGRGIEPDKLKDPESTGIIGMRERVLSLGGELKVHGEPGKGTTLKALIPYSRNRGA